MDMVYDRSYGRVLDSLFMDMVYDRSYGIYWIVCLWTWCMTEAKVCTE